MWVVIFFIISGSVMGQIKGTDSESVTEMKRLKGQVSQYEYSIATLEENNQSLENELSEAKRELYSLERARIKRNLETKRRFEEEEFKRKELEQEIADMKRRDAYLEQEIEIKEKRLNEKRTEIKGYKKRIKELEDKIDSLIEKIERKSDIIDAQGGVIIGLEQRLNGFKDVLPSFKLTDGSCKTVIKSYKESGEEEIVGMKKYKMINYDIEYYHNIMLGRIDEIRGYIIIYDEEKRYLTHTQNIQTLTSHTTFKNYQVFQGKEVCVLLSSPLDKNPLGNYTYAFVPESMYHYSNIVHKRYDDLCEDGYFLFINKNNRNIGACRTAALNEP